MHKLKVICVFYDDATYFEGWKKQVATNPFKINNKYTVSITILMATLANKEMHRSFK